MASIKVITIVAVVIAVILVGFLASYYLVPTPTPTTPAPTTTTTPTSTLTPTPAPGMYKITVVSGSTTGAYYLSTSAIIGAISSDLASEGIVLVHQAGGGGAVQLPMLHERRVDMAAEDIVDAKVLWDEKGYKDFRAVLIIAYFPAQLAVRTDAGIKCWKDLSGKPISIGSPGFIANRMFREIMSLLGIQPSKIYELGHRDSMDMLVRGDIVAYFFTGFPNPTVQEYFVKYKGAMTILPPCPDEQKLLREKLLQYSWIRLDMKGEKVYAGVDLEVESPTAVGILWTTPDMPTDVVYKIVKAYWKNRDVAAQLFPQHSWFKPETIIENLEPVGLPLHCGVIKYYREINVTVPPNLVPPECKT